MIILQIACIVATLWYLALLAYYSMHWQPAEEARGKAGVRRFVSVVIAARNEAAVIRRCLDALAAQDYPEGQFEIIVVDDQSEDTTGTIAADFPGVKLLHTDPGTPGKKAALAMGIRHARGEIIAVTDADCMVPRGWVGALASVFDAQTRMVTGPVLYTSPQNAFERFQCLDVSGLALITASGIRSGIHHLANGANMAFRKTAFEAVGGLDAHQGHASGDDLFLVQKIGRGDPRAVQYLWGKRNVVITDPCRSWSAFVEQRIRWASKNAALPEKNVLRIWACVWFTFVLNIAVLAAGIGLKAAAAGSPFLCILAIFGGEYLVLRRITRYYEQRDLLIGFPLSAVLHYCYVVMIGCMSFVRKRYTWKGRLLR